MAWIAVDEDKRAFVYSEEPLRGCDEWCAVGCECTDISSDAAELLIGRWLTWDDEPVEIKTV